MILSAKATEVVIEEIHEYLTELGELIRSGQKPLDDYIIHKVRASASTATGLVLIALLPALSVSVRTQRITPMQSRCHTCRSQ